MAQHFTILPERYAAQQTAHPDWTPELNDVAYYDTSENKWKPVVDSGEPSGYKLRTAAV